MSVDPVGAALGAASLASGPLKAFARSNEYRNFLNALRRDLGHTADIPASSKGEVWKRFDGLRLDPTFLGTLRRYLTDGDRKALDEMRQRLRELLRSDETELSADLAAEFVVASLERNRHRLKRNAEEASRLEHEITRDTIEEGVATLLTEQREMRNEIRAGLDASPVDRPMGVAVHASSSEFQEILERLTGTSAQEANQLQAVLAAGGATRVAELIHAPQAWLESGSAHLWIAAAQVALKGAYYEEAEHAFLVAAEHPGVEDRVRQIVRAAFMARVRDDEGRFEELFQQARTLDEGHTAVVLAEARLTGDADGMIDRLEPLVPQDEAQEADIQATLAGAYLSKGETRKARTAVEQALRADPENVAAREMEAVVWMWDAQTALERDDVPNRQEVQRAAQRYQELTMELLEAARFSEAGLLAAKGIEASLLADDDACAGTLLDVARSHPRTFEKAESALALAQAASHAQRFELVPSFLPRDVEDEQAQLVRGQSEVLWEGGDRELGTRLLTRLVDGSEDDDMRVRASLALLGAAVADPSFPWHEAAEDIVKEHTPWVAARLKAERLHDAGETDAAEEILRPHQAQPSVLRFLIRLRVHEEAWEQALRLSERLLARTPDERDRLGHAELLRVSGERVRARAEFLALARATDLTCATRNAAYRQTCGLLQDDGEFNELERVAAEWFDFAPDTRAAGWLRLYALARLTRFDDALACWRNHPVEVTDEQDGRLLAQILSLAAEPVEALEGIADLADRFPESETFHLALIATSLRHEGADLPDHLQERIKDTYAGFKERFPEATSLRSYSVDPEDVVGSVTRMVKEAQGNQADGIDELSRAVSDGTNAVSALAAVAGRDTGQVWLRYGGLPIGAGDPAIHDLELTAAAEALQKAGAVWDPSSLYVVHDLGDEIAQIAVNALPASVIAQSTLDEAAGVLFDPARDSRQDLRYDPELDQAILVSWNEEDVEREQARGAGMLELARKLLAKADRDPDGDDQLHELIDEDTPPQIAFWIATLIVARREGMPVFSDDRYIRATARSAGVNAFGTLALLDTLVDRGTIEPQLRADARRRLQAAGAWGLLLSPDELISIGRESDWLLTSGMVQTFNDICAWRASPRRMVELFLPCLQDVFERRPDKFQVWVNRLLYAFTYSMPKKDDAVAARAIILLAVDPIAQPPLVSDACFQALIETLRNVPYYLRMYRGCTGSAVPTS